MSINNNSATINSNTYPNYNVSSTVSLYGLRTNYVAPTIIRNGISICSSSTYPACINLTSLNAGNVIFTVSSWTNYSIEGDVTNPQVTFISPTPASGSGIEYQYRNLSVTTNVVEDNFANSTLFVYNITRDLIYNETNYTKISTFSFTPPYIGIFYYNVTAKDLANNFNSTETRSIAFVTSVFGFCNTTLTTPYLNFTFFNENTAGAMTAKINTLIATYWLSDPAFNKTFVFQNLTDHSSYAFCSYPTYLPINVSLRMQYSNTSFSSRWYSASTQYTNTTTNISLAMLATADSNYVTFIAYDSVYSTVIAGVDVHVYTDILGVTTSVTNGVTDAAGAIAFQLNPLSIYTLVYTKAGYNTYSQTVNPALGPYSVYLVPVTAPGSGVGGGVGGGSGIPHNNLAYKTYVIPDKAWFDYNTTMVFYFNVTTLDNNTYAGSRMEEWSNSTNMLNVTMINRTGTTTTLSLAGRCGNSSDPQTLILKYYVYNNSNLGMYNLITTNTYICGLDISTPGNHSLWTGLFHWGNTANLNAKAQFTNGWWTFFIIALIISGLCLWLDIGNFGGTDPMVISIGFTIVLWILSMAGNLFFIPGLGSDWIGRFVLAFISTLFMAGYIIKSMREK
jgi:hypothetical protein